MAEQRSHLLGRLAWRIVLAVAVAAGLAAAYTLRLENTYQARALMMVLPAPGDQENPAPDSLPIEDDPGMTRMLLPKAKVLDALPMPDYRAILLSPETLGKLQTKYMEEAKAANRPVKERSVAQLQRALDVKFKVHFQSLLKVDYQQVVELTVNDTDPAAAAGLANAWAKVSIDVIKELRQNTVTGTVATLQSARDEAWAQYQEARKALESLEAQYNIDAMHQRLNEMESSSSSWLWRKMDLSLEIAKTEAEIAAGDGQDKEKQAVLAGLHAQEAAIAAQKNNQDPDLAAFRTETARAARELDEAKLKAGSLAGVYEAAENRVHAGRVAAESTLRGLAAISDAPVPEGKSGPSRLMIVFAAMFLAAVAVPVHFFGMLALRRCMAVLERESC